MSDGAGEGGAEEGPSGSDEMDEAEAAPSAKRQRGGEAAAQNAQLYGEAGQFNPRKAKAAKKQAKRGALMRQAGAEVDAEEEQEAGAAPVADAEYDFGADWGAEAGGGAGSNPFAELGSGSGSELDE